MNSQQPPWWMYVVAASFFILHCITPYTVIFGPAEVFNLGQVGVDFEDAAMRVEWVNPDTPHAAVLRPGDIVLSVADHPVRSSRDWTVVLGNFEAGRSDRWEILRGAERLSVSITPAGRTWRGVVFYLPIVVFAFGSFAIGLLIAFKRPRDPVALAGAWFIVTASAALGAPGGWAVAWRQLPVFVQGLLWIPEINRFVIEGIFLTFISVFPQRLFRSRWPWLLIWLPVLATLPWRVSAFSSVIQEFGQAAAGAPGWLDEVIFARTAIYFAAGVAMLFVGYRRLVDRNQRRRVSVLVAGTAIGLAAAILGLWAFNISGQGTRLFVFWRVMVLPVMLACPVAFAYAILRHRLFDIQVIIRQGLQYAFARGAVLGVVPVLAVLLLLDLAGNSRQPLSDILEERGWIYGGLAGLATVAYLRRRPWLNAIDRRFFRERYNAEQLLREVVSEADSARSFESVLPRVAARIESALHPEYVAVMTRDPGDAEFHARISIPAGYVPPRIPAESKVAALVRVLGKPMELPFTDSQWRGPRLPDEEIAFIRRARIGLLLPIPARQRAGETLFLLGVKRSEEPYAHADQELLETIASSLALLADNAPPPARPEAANAFSKECPTCGACCEPELERCNTDGSELIVVRLPRILAHRYKLNRMLGRGGMGAVYEAKDTALDRRVAVKVIREDRVDEDAVRRFRAEARAAAGFTHPNVVTVHDYGVESQTRPFIVMELLEGVTLRSELRSRRRLEPHRIVEIMRPICSAVSAAHGRNLIHRDLKPENIFLSSPQIEAGETVKVLDFGLAKLVQLSDDATTRLTAETEAGVLLGTFAYMAPERLLGKSSDVCWDVWALGVIVYECLTGSLPFPVAPIDAWRSALLTGSFVPLNNHLLEPKLEWLNFFSSCFAVDRARRPESAAELFEQVQRTFTTGIIG